MENEKKSNKLNSNAPFMLLCIFLISIISIVLSFGIATYARYRMNESGNVVGEIAKWRFKVNGEEETFKTINFAETINYENVVDKKIAPGTKGDLTFEIDGRESEVSLKYFLDVYDFYEKPTNLIFYSDEDCTKPMKIKEDGSIGITGKILLSDEERIKKEKIYWKWDFTTGTTEDEIKKNNIIDTKEAGKNMSARVKVKGIQIGPNGEEPENPIQGNNQGSGDNQDSGASGENSGSGETGGSGDSEGGTGEEGSNPGENSTPVEKEYYKESDTIIISFEIEGTSFASVLKVANIYNGIIYASNPINLKEENVKVKIDGVETEINNKELIYKGYSNGNYNFELKISNIKAAGNIELFIEKDGFRKNVQTNIGESNRILISVNEKYPDEKNVYEYCVSLSNTELSEEDEWKTYSKNGTNYTIDNNGNETMYIWFKPLKDKAGNESIYNKTIGQEKYIIKGPYKFDIVKPVIKSGGFINMVSKDESGTVYDIPIEVVDVGGYEESERLTNLVESEIQILVDGSSYVPEEKVLTYELTENGKHMYNLRVKLITWGTLSLKFNENVISDKAGLKNIETEFEVIDIYADMKGSGTEEDPYMVYTTTHLNQMKNKLNKYYRLGKDITLEEIENWSPIGTESNPFTGGFDGDGKIIRNLTINSNESYKGLFGKSTGNIKKLKLDEVNISGADYIGALCGVNEGTIENIEVDNVIINGGSYTGGIIGRNYGIVLLCKSNVDVTGKNSENGIGGLIGRNDNGKVLKCCSMGNVEGYNYVGGIIGESVGDESIIQESYSSVNVKGTNNSAGGLIGDAHITIENCFATGNVVGNNYVGSLAGWLADNYVSNSYGIGEVSGNSNIGGLIGYYRNKDVRNSYYTPETVHQDSSDGGDVNCIAVMISKSGYNEWDFEKVWKIDEGNSLAYLSYMDTPNEIKISNMENITFFEGGNGSTTSPFKISTIEQLNMVRYCISANYELINNINLTEQWEPIGTENILFKGVFDGGNYTINNLNIQSSNNNIGLFAYSSGEIRNLKFSNVNLKGNDYVGIVANNSGMIKNVEIINGNVSGNSCIGGLVGENKGTITKCRVNIEVVGEDGWIGGIVGNNYIGNILKSCSSGSVVGYRYVGGIVGGGFDVTTCEQLISQCYSTADVEAINRTAGGIAGDVYIQIIDCYSTGTIKSPVQAGGIIGWLDNGKIENCYSISKIEGSSYQGGIIGRLSNYMEINNCFWSKATSGLEYSSYGTEADLTNSNTYSEWDFDNIWEFTGRYPTLRCFNSSSEISSVSMLCSVKDRFLEVKYLSYQK